MIIRCWNAALAFMVLVGTVVALVMLLLIFMVGVNIFAPVVKEWLSIKDWAAFFALSATVIGTLVTTAAVIVALWVATREGKWKKQLDLNKRKYATLYTKSQLFYIVDLSHQIEYFGLRLPQNLKEASTMIV